MKKQLLLPHACKNIGWILLAPSLITGILYLINPDIPFAQYAWYDELLVIGLTISMTMVAFSREKDEDEYTAAIRSRYLSLAFYADTLIAVIGTLAIYEFSYLNFMVIQMFLVLLLYIVMFNIAMWHIRTENKSICDEE